MAISAPYVIKQLIFNSAMCLLLVTLIDVNMKGSNDDTPENTEVSGRVIFWCRYLV